MKKILLLLFFVSQIAYSEVTTVFKMDFDENSKFNASPGKIVTGFKNTRSIQFESSQQTTLTRNFPVNKDMIDSRYVTLHAHVKTQDVSMPPDPWNGIKVMLVYETEGGWHYPQIPIPAGSYDWKAFSHTCRLEKNIKNLTLTIGLEKVSGKVLLDNIIIESGRAKRSGRVYEKKFTGHDLDRLRGVMHGPVFNEANIRDLDRWNVNQVRWQLNWVPMKQAEQWASDIDRYDKWLDGALEHCDKALDACEKYNIQVLVDLHCPPGGRYEGGRCRLFRDKKYQDHFLRIWDRIASRYKDRTIVYGYDLLNEAVVGTKADGLMDWNQLAGEAVKIIRKYNPGKPVVFEPDPWGSAYGFVNLVPLDMENVIYSFHMYQPHQFTHQGVYGNKTDVSYPGDINGKYWDKEALLESMLPAIEFQQDFNVQIYVGEFSSIRWAPDNSAYRWMTDVIDIFEQYKWDWSYHAFREWDGWSVEHGTDKNDRTPLKIPGKRQKLLLKWFAENQRINESK